MKIRPKYRQKYITREPNRINITAYFNPLTAKAFYKKTDLRLQF